VLGLGSIGYVQSFQYVLINIEPVRPSDYSQFVFLALCVFDFDIPVLRCSGLLGIPRHPHIVKIYWFAFEVENQSIIGRGIYCHARSMNNPPALSNQAN